MLRPQVHLEAVKPRASRSDVYYSGFVVGQKWSIADLRRSKNTPPSLVKLFALSTSNTLWYCFNIVFLFLSFSCYHLRKIIFLDYPHGKKLSLQRISNYKWRFRLNFYSNKMFKFKKENYQRRTQEFVNAGGGSASVEPKNPLETIYFTDSGVGWAPLAPPPSHAFECKWKKRHPSIIVQSFLKYPARVTLKIRVAPPPRAHCSDNNNLSVINYLLQAVAYTGTNFSGGD